MPTQTDTHPRLLDALASLNQISAAINRIGPGDRDSVEATLRLIAGSAIKVVPGASAVIYTYDQAQRTFDPASRVSAGERSDPVPGDEPRPDGMGMRAIGQRRRVLSYEEGDLDIHPVKVEAGAGTVACYPLVVADQAVGILYVYVHEARRFSQLELLMLENFVNQAAMGIYHARRLASVQRDLARKEDELARLRRAGLLISSRLRLEETLEAILQMALEVTNAQYGIFRLVDKSGQNLITRAIAGEHLSRPLVETLPIKSNSVMGWVARHRQPMCIPDLRSEPWAHIYYPLDHDLEMRSELAVPLIGASGRLEGVLNLESPTVGAFNESDSHLLQALATQAVIAIQEVRLLDALQEIAERLLTQPPQQVLDRLVELACDLLNATVSAIWTMEGNELVVQAASAGHVRGERLPLHSSLAGQAIINRTSVISDDVRTDPRFYRADLALAQGWSRALVVPMLASNDISAIRPAYPVAGLHTGDTGIPARAAEPGTEVVTEFNLDREPVGAFSVYGTDHDPGRFAESEWDEKVLICLAHYAALAVHNAARQEALHTAQEQRAVAETFAGVGDITANLLHQLNNKLGSIPVRIQGIQDKCQPALMNDLYLVTNLEEIERSASEAMAAVRENLYHLRPIHLVPVEVADCVKAAIAAANLPPGLQVQLKGLDELPAVVAGQRSLTLVFVNLLENATDAMKGDGTVVIRGAVRDDWVEVAVSDSGPGIAPELHDRIFEFSFSGRTSARAGKLGFGLWWVKTLMARLGGSIAVESDGCLGTTFRLRLPRVEEVP